MRHLCPWDFPGKNTGAGCHFLLRGIFLTQGSNPHLLRCSLILYRGASREAAGIRPREGQTAPGLGASERERGFPRAVAGVRVAWSWRCGTNSGKELRASVKGAWLLTKGRSVVGGREASQADSPPGAQIVLAKSFWRMTQIRLK